MVDAFSCRSFACISYFYCFYCESLTFPFHQSTQQISFSPLSTALPLSALLVDIGYQMFRRLVCSECLEISYDLKTDWKKSNSAIKQNVVHNVGFLDISVCYLPFLKHRWRWYQENYLLTATILLKWCDSFMFTSLVLVNSTNLRKELAESDLFFHLI